LVDEKLSDITISNDSLLNLKKKGECAIVKGTGKIPKGAKIASQDRKEGIMTKVDIISGFLGAGKTTLKQTFKGSIKR
jgi:hypothetical protein